MRSSISEITNYSTDDPPDILKSAAEIAAFLFGTTARRREVYHLVEQGALPHFKLGSIICARRSTLMKWIAQMEAS